MRIASSEDSQPADPSIPTAEERTIPNDEPFGGHVTPQIDCKWRHTQWQTLKTVDVDVLLKRKKMTRLIFLFVIYLLFNWN